MVKYLLIKTKTIFLSPVTQTLFVIVIISFFLFTVSYFLLFPAIETSEKNAISTQRQTAFQTKNLLDIFIKLRVEELKTYGDQVLNDQKAIQGLKDSFFKNHTDILSVMVLDPTGKIINLSSNPQKNLVPEKETDFSNTRFFQESIKGNTYFSPVYLSSGGPILRISTPIYISNNLAAVVASEFDMSLIREVVNISNIEKGKIYIVDPLGTIISDPDITRSNSGDNLSYRQIVQDLVSGSTEVSNSIYKNENNVQVLSYGIKMPNTNWGIVVEQDYVFALQQKERTFQAAISFAGASFIFIFLLVLGTIRLSRALVNINKERERVSAEKNKLAITLSSINDAIIAVDLHHKITIFNKAAETMTGYPSVFAMNKDISSLIKIYFGQRELTPDEYCPITKNINEGIVFAENSLKMIGNQNKQVYISLTAGHIKEGLTTNLGCILTLHNKTQEIQLEKMKVDFVSMAAHELRTPLTVIRSYLSVFTQDVKDKLSDVHLKFLQEINFASQQLNALIENLLSVSKIENGAVILKPEPIDLVEVTKQAVEGFYYQAKEKNIALNFIAPSQHLPKVMADRLRIAEVLGNLLTNALRYTNEGSVTVWIEQKGNELITHIRDTGTGIKLEDQKFLFIKFFRAWDKLEMSSRGTGLGLYISKSIIEQNKGRIWVESEVNKGSTFSYSLPIANDQA